MILLALFLAGAAPSPVPRRLPTPAPTLPAVDGAVKSSDGVAIRYHAEGSGDPTLVFVHGWSCDRHYWDAQTSVFAKGHRVVTLDLGGHGESGLGRRDWTIPAFADDVQAVVRALGLERVVLVGHSMGGPVSVEVARRMPDCVVAILIADTFNNLGSHTLSKEDWDGFVGTLRADFPGATADFVRKGMFTPRSDPALVERVVAAMSAAHPEVGISAMDALFVYDAAAALTEVHVPVRAINSDRRPTDVEAARRFAPQFDAVIMKGVGHFVMMEDPTTFNQLLEEFLAGLAPAPKPAPR